MRLIIIFSFDTLQDVLLFHLVGSLLALVALDSGLDPFASSQTLALTSIGIAKPLHDWTVDRSQF